MTMPGLSGEQTFSALRRIRPDLPVLATSGSAVEDLPDFMRGQEAVGFIPKPCNLQDLHRALTSVVEPGWREWPAREELAAHEPRNAARGW
jgi:DNA-binding NtrC family response regulator